MSHIVIYVTCADSEEAQKIAGLLLEKDLIACANILQPHMAIYKWEGAVESGQEQAMILKTRADLFDEVEQAICAVHSYECPCIVAMPVIEGHDPFLQWINDQTEAP